MASQPANAVCCRPPARHPGLVRTSRSACLSLSRARDGRRRSSNVFRAFQPFTLADGLGAGAGKNCSSLRSSPVCSGGLRPPEISFFILHSTFCISPLASPSRLGHSARRDSCRLASCPAAARFGPRPGRTRQLCTRSTPLPHSAAQAPQDAIAAFRRPQTGETGKDIRAHPKTPQAAMLRISAKTSNMGARLRLPPRTKQ